MALPDTAKGCWCKTLHQYFKQHYLLISYLGQKEKVAHQGYGPAGVSLGKRSEKGRPLRKILSTLPAPARILGDSGVGFGVLFSLPTPHYSR